MPELPEVETIRRQLANRLPGRRIVSVERSEPFMLRDVSVAKLASSLRGRRVESVTRRGKFLLLSLEGDLVLTVHLGMTGQLLLQAEKPSGDHVRFSFILEGGGSRLVFRDMRKFGRLHLTHGGPAARVEAMGPDAWLGDWTADDLARLLARRRAPLKAFLLDQRRLAGVGNIYADEILFEAGLSPLRPAGALSPGEVGRLAAAVREKLDEGVRLRGCSISDYVDVEGRAGGFQGTLKAYGRHGQSCLRCGATLVRAIVAGRGTAFCPSCQH
ncbi:MAG: bifunctional DNA-formamidopyrimidine glycosylase/DNA-(apurinic or apyrimidinic site) lyase [Thermoleophilia bacterium]|nr:bifunctional DNA-formamidopyrimidine glycosylase/DNA-(apurinic or apyrimidinic site) lyase [Thermoleophilia bacterium]